jgi:aerobic carbon-monoxide dehydrogenase medium subunit
VKPSPFTYHRPGTLPEALDVLAGLGADAKVLAGGQSLLPMLSMRLAAPGHLVDINRLPGLDRVDAGPDGVRIGALARHAAVGRDPDAARVQPLLRQALRLVAHPTIRNRGTSLGSLVHADPSGELTAVLALTGGRVRLDSAGGTRTVAAADFFLGPLTSALEPGEVAVEAFFPALPAGAGSTMVEVARRNGDYAVCGVAAIVTVHDGTVTSARAGYVSVADTPVVLDLTGTAPGAADAIRPEAWVDAGAAAAGQLDPEPDIHASADYRRHLARVLTARALAEAATRATRGPRSSEPAGPAGVDGPARPAGTARVDGPSAPTGTEDDR